MIARIGISRIIKGHLKTLRNLKNRDSKYIYWSDFILFYLLPVIIAIICSYFQLHFKSITEFLIAGISIFGGFLFNLLAIIYSQMENLGKDAAKNDLKKVFIKEIHSNISYCILLSVFSVIVLIAYSINVHGCLGLIWKNIFHFLSTIILSMFFLTLLMVINRVYVLLDKEVTQD